MKPHYIRRIGATLVLGAALSTTVSAADPTLVMYNGTALHAIRSGDTICVSFRELCEAAGYAVNWLNGAAIAVGQKEITARPGEDQLEIDDFTTTMDTPVQLINDRTIVPVRHLADALGMSVTYDYETGIAMVRDMYPDVQPDLPGTIPVLPEETPDNSTMLPSEPELSPENPTVQPDDLHRPSYSEEDLYWLARIIEAEAGAESIEGKIAVGNVVLNRVADSEYPNNIYDVIFDTEYGTQFEPTSNGTIYNTPSEESIEAAKRALAGENVIGDAIYFYNPSLVDAVWIRTNCTYLQTIGCHDFYV